MTPIRTLGFHHLAVQADDVEAVAAFYRDVLGLPELERYRTEAGVTRSIWLGVARGEGTEAGFLAVERRAGTPASEGRLSMVALRIAPETRAEVEAELARQGVAIERRTRWTMYVRDPEGNLIGLSHHPSPGVDRGREIPGPAAAR